MAKVDGFALGSVVVAAMGRSYSVVARMQRSAIRGNRLPGNTPDSAALHPGYLCCRGGSGFSLTARQSAASAPRLRARHGPAWLRTIVHRAKVQGQ